MPNRCIGCEEEYPDWEILHVHFAAMHPRQHYRIHQWIHEVSTPIPDYDCLPWHEVQVTEWIGEGVKQYRQLPPCP